jgi:PAS domain-containing protein
MRNGSIPLLGLRISLSTKAPLLDADGQIVGLVGVAKDITDRKKREEETKYLHKWNIG